MKKLLAQLFGGTSPNGRKLRFRSAGWRGTQLVLEVSHEAAGAPSVAGGASVSEAGEDEASQAGQQRSAGGGAQSQARAAPAPAASTAPAAAAAAAPAAPAAAAGATRHGQAGSAAAAGQQEAEVVDLLDNDRPPVFSPQATNPAGEHLQGLAAGP